MTACTYIDASIRQTTKGELRRRIDQTAHGERGFGRYHHLPSLLGRRRPRYSICFHL